MSKVIYVLDKIVWMLIITAVTTQALQIAGVVETPNRGLSDISYMQDNEYRFQVQVGDADTRGKRQTDQRSQFLDNLFKIPVSTLNAVNDLVQSARPAFQSLRENAARRLDRLNKDIENRQNRRQQTLPSTGTLQTGQLSK